MPTARSSRTRRPATRPSSTNTSTCRRHPSGARTSRSCPSSKHTTADGTDPAFVTVPMPASVRLQPAGIAAIVVALPPIRRAGRVQGPPPATDLRRHDRDAAALIVGAVLWASLYRPLGRVTRGIRAVAQGNYGERVPVSGPREVRALGRRRQRHGGLRAGARSARCSDFLANVSHELKTPLTSIRGFSQAMLDGTLDTPEERARAARVIDVESRRLLHLVGELLDLSRIESGQQAWTSPSSVAELLSHVEDVFSMRADEASVRCELDVRGRPAVRADFDRIEQVLEQPRRQRASGTRRRRRRS